MDIGSREEVRHFYTAVYQASEGIPIGWTGSHTPCDAGDTLSEFKDAVERRINFFRAMAGIPASVTLFPEFSAKAQQAALMMSANDQLNHFPPANWSCYTADGAEAAGKSNLSIGHNGPSAITGFIFDAGNIDPVALFAPWEELRRRADRVLTYLPAGKAGNPARAGTYDFVITKFVNPRGGDVAIGAAPIVAFSALGDNERFAGDMRRYRLAAFRAFSDHHGFTPDDILSLERLRKAHGGDWLVCTEKDFCKIRDFLPPDLL